MLAINNKDYGISGLTFRGILYQELIEKGKYLSTRSQLTKTRFLEEMTIAQNNDSARIRCFSSWVEQFWGLAIYPERNKEGLRLCVRDYINGQLSVEIPFSKVNKFLEPMIGNGSRGGTLTKEKLNNFINEMRMHPKKMGPTDENQLKEMALIVGGNIDDSSFVRLAEACLGTGVVFNSKLTCQENVVAKQKELMDFFTSIENHKKIFLTAASVLDPKIKYDIRYYLLMHAYFKEITQSELPDGVCMRFLEICKGKDSYKIAQDVVALTTEYYIAQAHVKSNLEN